MTMEKLIYRSTSGQSLEFFVNGDYHVNVSKDVTGLWKVLSEVNSTPAFGTAGSHHNSSRILPRDIQILGTLNSRDKATRRQRKDHLVSLFNPMQKGTLEYILGDHKRWIECYVDGEINFTPTELLENFIINLSCLNPFWREDGEQLNSFTETINNWKFPCKIPPTGWTFGQIVAVDTIHVENRGHYSVGMKLVLTANNTIINPKITLENTREFLQINATLQKGDVVEINTGFGQKSILMNGLDGWRYLDERSSYFQLALGDNTLTKSMDNPENGDYLDIDVIHENLFMGA
jgi:Phage tail protein.